MNMQKVILTLLLICSMAAYGKERYSVRTLPLGNMYFFMPCKLKANAGNKLQYDMTLHSYRDSVTINMTLTSPMGRVKSVRLSAGDVDYSTTHYELFFQERNGSRFNTRVHIDCPGDIYAKLFASNVPLTIELTMESGKQYAFTYKTKKWEEDSQYVTEVLEMIAYTNSRQ
jgi:hypothetical protein